MGSIEKIFNFIKIDDLLHTSGQPTEDEIKLLAQSGFQIIVNIRPETEMKEVFDEKNLVESLGIEYIQLPMTFDTLNNNILDEFFSIIEKIKDKKVLVHCHRNIRITALLGFYRLIKLGWDKEKAFKEHERFVEITPEFHEFIEDKVKKYRNG